MVDLAARPMKTLLVAGSDWGVGKTVALATLLCDSAPGLLGDRPVSLSDDRPAGLPAPLDWAAIKLIQCCGEDNAVLVDWLGRSDIALTAPLRFSACLDPLLAAAQAEQGLSLAELWQALTQQSQNHRGLLIEGVGRLSSVITPQATLADLAADWKLPVLLVAAVHPQVLSELIAQTAVARQANCDLRGIVLNCPTFEAQNYLLDWANPRLIETLTGYPVLGKIPYLAPSDRAFARLAQVAAELELESVWS